MIMFCIHNVIMNQICLENKVHGLVIACISVNDNALK